MQRSASAKSGSAAMADRPLSTMTMCSSRPGASGPVMNVVYTVMSCAVPERASSRAWVVASSQVGTSFSQPASTTWTGGSDEVSRPLPSLVTSMTVPVSAMRALAPVMPTWASAKTRRSSWRATPAISPMFSRETGWPTCASKRPLTCWRLLDGRHDHVRRRLVGELDDPFAEVRLHRLHARRLESVIQEDLLGHHRLALGEQGGPTPPAELDDVADGIGRGRRLVDDRARRLRRLLEADGLRPRRAGS